jgi:hypothetical protein
MADDWVRARAECSIHNAFMRLITGAKSDTDARKEIAQRNGEVLTFDASPIGDRLLVTRIEGTKTTAKVEFALSGGVISISGDAVNIKATPGLNTTGECRLTVNATEFELWQIRRMALEAIFFDESLIITAKARGAKL